MAYSGSIFGVPFHQGQWFGLPDFGATERVASNASGGRTTDLGNAMQGVYQAQPGATYTNTTGQQINSYGGSGGSVLDATTTNGGANTNTGGSGSGQVLGAATTGGQTTGSSGPSYQDIMYNQINNGYNDYFNSLDQMLNNTLPQQQQYQQNIAQNSYDTSMADLGLNRTNNQQLLDTQSRKAETNQVKSLKDISSQIRNLMQGANNYLGALGAGDSSAANQYAYALTKVGSQQAGDVRSQTASTLQDINDKSTQLNNIYMQESNKLKGEYNNAIQSIGQWFSEQQNNLIQAKAQGQLSKSQDLQSLTTNLYNQAIAGLQSVQNQIAQKQSTLETWAANNATTLNQLKQNMAAVSQYTAQAPTYSLAGATPSMTPRASSGGAYGGYSAGGAYDDYIKKLLGQA